MLTGTRITPNQIEPEIGGIYRQRKDGCLYRLVCVAEGNHHILASERSSRVTLAIHVSDFWNRFIHSEARI